MREACETRGLASTVAAPSVESTLVSWTMWSIRE